MGERKVLLVEDEKNLLERFAERIRGGGYEVLTAENGVEAWKIFQGTTILVVVTDIMMPGKSGLEILQDIKTHSPATQVIVMTGLSNDHAVQALNLRAFHYIEKGGRGAGQKLLEAINWAFKEAEAHTRIEKEMLDFLTHTLFSSISGGPETVEQVLEYAQSALGDRYHESDVYKMINNIASLKAIFMSMDNMLHTYQILANEPDAFGQKWQEEQAGSLSLKDLLAAVLRQTLGSLLFEEANLEQLIRLLASQKSQAINTLRETFLKDVFWSEEGADDVGRVSRWLERYFPILSLELEGAGPHFDAGGVRYPFLFAILSEIVYNALKYTDCREPVRIEWVKREDEYLFSCRNTFSLTSTKRRGSQRGLAFVTSLTRMVEGIGLFRKSENDVFTVELRLKGNLLEGGEVI